ncbi:hypothetical protein [Pararhizobium gei]|uniref:hypothetical protein n=1 Tax=Pararhizobium gei TaxID=1395951 RepID=UPI0023D9F614|nr:hypothetical protein [Rhizobium gei]
MVEDATAAIRHFPDRSRAIADLVVRDESFRDMCADFAMAQAELQKWRASTEPFRERRIGEYGILVEELAAEIAAALDAAAIVSFPRR